MIIRVALVTVLAATAACSAAPTTGQGVALFHLTDDPAVDLAADIGDAPVPVPPAPIVLPCDPVNEWALAQHGCIAVVGCVLTDSYIFQLGTCGVYLHDPHDGDVLVCNWCKTAVTP